MAENRKPEWKQFHLSASNRETWIRQCRVFDLSGDPVDITEASFAIGIYDDNDSLVLSEENATIEVVVDDDDNLFQWTFSEPNMRTLCTGTYKIGLTITIADIIRQGYTGTLNIFDGYVP